ncbi:MAG: hypothetical protein J7M40_12450, partial [Planctomycetes bacterium]|nr:hypothetical protein [Planctomycetota bacterium]
STVKPLKFDLPPGRWIGTPPNLTRIPNIEPLCKTPRPPFYAPAGAKNLALGKLVTSTDDLPIIGELEMIADDADFTINVRTVFNNDTDNSTGLGVGSDKLYVDTYEGRLIDAKGQRARYVRLYSNGNQESDLNHYTEVEVWGRPAITKTPKEKFVRLEIGPGLQHVTVDLGASHELSAIVLWHAHHWWRVYHDVIVQVAADPNFTDAVTLFNNDRDNSAGLGKGGDREYLESNFGKLVDAGRLTARYVRTWSNGCVANEFNNYVELAVYGRPVDAQTNRHGLYRKCPHAFQQQVQPLRSRNPGSPHIK